MFWGDTMENLFGTCCFFGHRRIEKTAGLKAKLYDEVERLIAEEKVDTFLFGSKSQFDTLCLAVVTDMKKRYPHIKRVYVRSEYQYIDAWYKEYLLGKYDDTYFPKKIENSGRASYVERNREMIDKSQFCIVYYDKDYLPPKRKNSRKDLTDYQPKSGTALAYNYSIKKGKKVINLFS